MADPAEFADASDLVVQRRALTALPYLASSGWLKSVELKLPVDAQGRALPWYSYPSIDFLARRVRDDMDVFEFGSGNSTLWWAEHARSVTAVEHHPEWAARMMRQVPNNVALRQIDLEPDGEYSFSAHASRRRFHVIVIDGRDRVNCARNCLGALHGDGVIVWDDSQRRRYRPGHRYLARRGFRALEFFGLGPMAPTPKETSVFYRDGNCFGI